MFGLNIGEFQMKDRSVKRYNKIMIITDDLLVANHLTIILKEIGILEFNIILEANKAVEMIKYAGHDVLLISKEKLIELKRLNLIHHFAKIKIIILGSKINTDDSSNMMGLSKYQRVAIPFVNHDIKKLFLESKQVNC